MKVLTVTDYETRIPDNVHYATAQNQLNIGMSSHLACNCGLSVLCTFIGFSAAAVEALSTHSICQQHLLSPCCIGSYSARRPMPLQRLIAYAALQWCC